MRRRVKHRSRSWVKRGVPQPKLLMIGLVGAIVGVLLLSGVIKFPSAIPTPNSSYDYTVSTSLVGQITAVSKSGSQIYQGSDARTAITQAMANLATTGGTVYVDAGTYQITTNTLIIPINVELRGAPNEATKLSFTSLPDTQPIVVKNNAKLTSLYIFGSATTSSNDFTQRIPLGTNSIVNGVTLSKLAYGFDLGIGVKLFNIKCDGIQSRSDWGACIHGSAGTDGVLIDGFNISNSNRAIEFDAKAKNVVVKNGVISNIRNFAGTGHEAFTLDVHSHDGEGGADNFLFQHVTLIDSNAPSAKTAGTAYNVADMPRNIKFEDITIRNAKLPFTVAVNGLEMRDIKFEGTTVNAISIYKNSQNIKVIGVTVDSLAPGKYAVGNIAAHTGIRNVEITDSDITKGATKSAAEPAMVFNNISGLTLRNNAFHGFTNPISQTGVTGYSETGTIKN